MARHVDNNPGNKSDGNSPLLYVIVALLVLMVLLLTALLVRGCNKSTVTGGMSVESGAEDYTGDRPTYTGKKNTDTIDIPGYASLRFQAGVTTQAVNLHNPEQNSCYFRMSLLLADGTELWRSDLVEPGKAVYQIELNQPLEAGTYEDAILKYECFAMDDAQSPLNGSEIELDLIVLE